MEGRTGSRVPRSPGSRSDLQLHGTKRPERVPGPAGITYIPWLIWWEGSAIVVLSFCDSPSLQTRTKLQLLVVTSILRLFFRRSSRCSRGGARVISVPFRILEVPVSIVEG